MSSEKLEKEMETSPAAEGPAPHPRKLKILTTTAIMLGNVTFGCAFNFYNPALEDLRIKYSTDIDDISTVFTVMLVCYCVGALLSGIVYNFINRQLGVIACLAGMAIGLFVTPHCPTKTWFFATGGFLGFFVGAYDASQVVWMIEIWQEKAGPFIQAQHFCYAVGSNIPSLVLAPFLRGDDDDDDQDIISTTTIDPDEVSKMWIPFSIGGLLSTIAFLIQLFLYIFHRYYVPPMYTDNNIQDQDDNNNNDNELEKSDSKQHQIIMEEQKEALKDWWKNLKSFKTILFGPRLRLIILAGLFCGTYQGMEMCTMQFIPTYGQYSDLELTESKAAVALTGLTGAFAVGRLLGIFIIMKISPVFILIGNLILVLTGNLILLLLANNSLGWFWAGVIIIGAGFSTMFASISAFFERNLIFTDAIGSFVIVCGSGIAAIYPVIVGNSIEDNPPSITYTSFFSITVCTCALILGIMWTKNSNRRY